MLKAAFAFILMICKITGQYDPLDSLTAFKGGGQYACTLQTFVFSAIYALNTPWVCVCFRQMMCVEV